MIHNLPCCTSVIKFTCDNSEADSNWMSEASPTLGVQSRFCMIYICQFVYGKPIQKNCMPKCLGGITWSKHAHAQSQFCEFETKCRLESLILPSSGRLKPTRDTRIIHFYYTLEQL